MNKVIVLGNITKKPELRQIGSGSNVANFSLAINEKYKDKQGQWVEKTEFVNVVAWGRTAEVCAQYLDKGSKCIVEGKLQTSSYDKNGEKRYKTEVICSNMQMLGGKPQGQPQQQSPQGYQDSPPSYESPQDDLLPF